ATDAEELIGILKNNDDLKSNSANDQSPGQEKQIVEKSQLNTTAAAGTPVDIEHSPPLKKDEETSVLPGNVSAGKINVDLAGGLKKNDRKISNEYSFNGKKRFSKR